MSYSISINSSWNSLTIFTTEVADIVMNFVAALLLEVIQSPKQTIMIEAFPTPLPIGEVTVAEVQEATPTLDTPTYVIETVPVGAIEAAPANTVQAASCNAVKAAASEAVEVTPPSTEASASPKRKRVSWSENVDVIHLAPTEDAPSARPSLKANTSAGLIASSLFGQSAFRYPALPSSNTRRPRRHSCPPVASPRVMTPTKPAHPITGTCVGVQPESTESSKASKRHSLDIALRGAWSDVKHAVGSMSHRNTSRRVGNSFTQPKLARAKPIHVRDLFSTDS